MKILNLKIRNPQKDIVRDIDFEQKGISYVYGDIQEPSNKKATINSLGKTLLLKFIDYIYGANEDKKIVVEEISGYILEAKVLFHQKEYNVVRVLGESKEIGIDDKKYTLTDYRAFFEINRVLYSKQIITAKKSTEISYRSNPDKTDVMSCLQLLGLFNMLSGTYDIYTSQDRISDLKAQKKEIVSYYKNCDSDQIDEEIYFIDKEVERLKAEINIVSKKIKEIDVSALQQNVVTEYADKGKELKALKREYEKQRIECERLEEFLLNSRKNDLTSEQVLLIFQKVNQEIPEMVKRELKEVEEFHNRVYKERAVFLGTRKKQLERDMEHINEKLQLLSEQMDELGRIIATNEVYQESIELYGKFNRELQEMVYKQGELSQVKNVDNCIEEEKAKLTEYFGKIVQIRKTYEKFISECRDFVFTLIRSIYDKEVKPYFDIKIHKQHEKARPVIFEFTIRGDTGEGVGEVKKNLMDYLMCKYNEDLEILIQDSACYSGIDPRQIVGLLNNLEMIAIETGKQVIVSINKYQLAGFDEVAKYIENHSAVILSENDKLLRFNY